ncbi:MAG: ABC transporter permease subunit [Bauldia sp.]|nr:ABC transporter permease subunit [Bauldia sp.]
MASDTSMIDGTTATLPSRPRAAADQRGVNLRPIFRSIRLDVFGAIGLILLIVLWWGLTFVVPRSSLPSPLAVFRRIADDFIVADVLSYYGLPQTGLLGSMGYTAANVLVAVVVGGLIGTVLGLFAARVQLARAISDPILNTVGTIPILVMAPFFLIWFGTGRWSAVLLVTVYVLVILYLFAQRAAENLDPVYENYAQTFGAHSGDILRDVLIPGTLPQVLGGIRIALAGAWGLEAIAELLGAQQGIGKIIEVLAGSLDIEGIFAALLVLGIVAVVADRIAGAIVRYITRWSVSTQVGTA